MFPTPQIYWPMRGGEGREGGREGEGGTVLYRQTDSRQWGAGSGGQTVGGRQWGAGSGGQTVGGR